jgi:hypothetical protein
MGTIVAHGHDLGTATSITSLLVGLQSCSLVETAPHQHQQGHQVDEAGADLAQPQASATLGELPDEVLLVVASHLGVPALGAFAQVDRRIRAIAEDDALWRDMFAARFGFRPKNAPASWKLAYCDYEATPRWHSTQKHPELIIQDDGLTVTMPTSTGADDTNESTDNRTIRATVEYKPGSGLHYFEVTSLCPNDVRYHPYVGICSTEEAMPVERMVMWLNDQCYAYGGNGTLYSSQFLEGNHTHLGKYQYGDKIGIMVDYREEEHGWLTFFLNMKAVSSRLRITGTWFPCVGTFHPRHAIQIVVRPRVPEPLCDQELANA